ncbi:hypothetical protein LCGC14_2807380, partial [marine sediment metagenome]
MRDKILKDIGGTLTYKYFENDIQVKPASGTITIFDNAGAEIVEEIAISIDAVGTMTYDLSAANSDEVVYSWKAIWKFVVSGDDIYRSRLFDIVNQILENPVVDNDIIKEAPFLKDKNYRKVFTAEVTSTKTVIVSSELREDDDYWNGGSAEVQSGTNAGEIRKVTDFVKSTNKLTVESFTAVIDTTSKINVTRTFRK